MTTEFNSSKLKIKLKGRPTKIFPLLFGWEPIPESVSLLGGRQDVFILEPVTGAAIAYENGWVLIDTGFNPDLSRNADLRAAHFTWPNYCAVIPPGDPLVDQISASGLSWDNLAFCAMSHLHCDHGGGLRLLVGGPPIVIQEREFDFAMNRAGLEHAYFRSDYVREGLNWELVSGDTELAPGLTALITNGHTPGHMSFAVELGIKRIVLACDAADFMKNIVERIPCGETAEPADRDAAETSINRLADLSLVENTEVWPGHDPEFWKFLKKAPEFYN